MKFERIMLLVFAFLFITAATITQITTFQDGNILTAAQLNNEFGQLIATVNNLDDDNIDSSANISGTKLNPNIAGDGLGITSGIMSVNDDNSTVEISGDVLRVKDDGITGAKLAPAIAGDGLLQNGSGNLEVDVDNTTIEINADNLRVKDAGISAAKMAPLPASSSTGTDPGAGGLCKSSNINFSTTSGSFTSITNAGCILTTVGRPVLVTLVGTTTASYVGCTAVNHCKVDVKLKRNGTDLADNFFDSTLIGPATAPASSGIQRVPCSSVSYIDTPAAGTWTYAYDGKIAAAGGSGNTLEVINCRVVAYEL